MVTNIIQIGNSMAVGSHPWLSSLLRQEVGIKEVRRYSGMQNP